MQNVIYHFINNDGLIINLIFSCLFTPFFFFFIDQIKSSFSANNKWYLLVSAFFYT